MTGLLSEVPCVPAPGGRADRCRPAVRACRPAVRAELALAVAARRYDDAVPQATWGAVADCLEVTGLALACADDEGDPASSGLLAACALQAGAFAELILGRGKRDVAPRAGQPESRSASSLDRTSVRLAGLLLGALPADPGLLGDVLASHVEALACWRSELLAEIGHHGEARPGFDSAISVITTRHTRTH